MLICLLCSQLRSWTSFTAKKKKTDEQKKAEKENPSAGVCMAAHPASCESDPAVISLGLVTAADNLRDRGWRWGPPGIMDMMKEMYDDGDEQTKKVIGEAMLKSRSGDKSMPDMPEL